MPYKSDPRRTVTINLYPDEYAALAEDALEAGYTTPGTYAKALVLERGEAPSPIYDQRGEERLLRLEGQKEWLLAQFEAAQQRLLEANVPFKLAKLPGNIPQPRSWAAQERAVQAAVATALEQERARVARQAAKQAAKQSSNKPSSL
jgi:hypothetical protein